MLGKARRYVRICFSGLTAVLLFLSPLWAVLLVDMILGGS